MGLFNIIKESLGETPLDMRGHCPVCQETTNQVQTGVLGQSNKIECKKCRTIWKKNSNDEWIRIN